ncbi:RDD family protein [Phormidium sp. CCY1219]|uniref:RDD family protein n=1 Tax=Phormidium sp. CCY1219 TaxID=2886104 RepID=UPI002D1F5246|nr:RDD family protein [Phormidium sp. CCY1219]MEB3831029.1 RDD family protein [Phormidium sp. CCY1219]
MKLFNKIRLQTPESVELELTLAGIGNRAYALMVDYLYLTLIQLGIVFLWFFASIYLIGFIERLAGSGDRLQLWLIAILLFVLFVIYAGYFVFFEVLWQGQTPGKRRVNIRVIRDDGRPCGMQQASLRALLRPVDDLLLIGVGFIVFGKREKRLGDWVAGTLVIQEEQAIAEANFSLSQTAHSLADDLLEVGDLSLLTPDDFAIVREYLQRRNTLTSKAKVQVSRNLATQTKRAIALEKVPQKVTAEVFLEAVYIAYQEYASRYRQGR